MNDCPPLLRAAFAVQRLIEAPRVRGVLIGGVAVGLLGGARSTQDVDAVILWSSDKLQELIELAAAHGLFPRIDGLIDFARRSRVLLLVHSETGVPVDISLGALPFEELMISNARVVDVPAGHLTVPLPEDLIVTKAVANRPKDRSDIAALLRAHPDVKREQVRMVVAEFAAVLKMPELIRSLDAAFRENLV